MKVSSPTADLASVAGVRDSIEREVYALDGIDLARLEELASLTVRLDRKYIVDPADLESMLLSVGNRFRALEMDGRREFSYESVYFDTAQLDTYMMSARSRPRRVKVRTRSYLDSDLCNLEVKRRDARGVTRKSRLRYPMEHRSKLTGEAHRFLAREGLDLGPLHRSLVVGFSRRTLVDTSTWSRITIDLDLAGWTGHGQGVGAFQFALVETKTTGHPCLFDRALWANHYRPRPISKYCTLMATLDPTLPANKWNRTLRNHLEWKPAHS